MEKGTNKNKIICQMHQCTFFANGCTEENTRKQCKAKHDKSICAIAQQGCKTCINYTCPLRALLQSNKGPGYIANNNKKPIAIAYIDGSYNPLNKTYGYGVSLTINGQNTTYSGKGNNENTAKIRNIAGEILGACRAVNEAKHHGAEEITIYYDYTGIENWVTGKWNTKNDYTKKYKKHMLECGLKLNFKKVKAHSGDIENEKVDKLAKIAVGL